jgi:Rad3-related DNA helicase
LNTAVFSSATLAVNGNFDYFSNRICLRLVSGKAVYSDMLGSPFDFNEQARVGVLDFMPDPRDSNFAEELADTLKSVHAQHKTGMLVLFTSYGLLNKIYELLKPHFDGERVLLLAQGKSGSRTNLINQFKEFRDSILLGTDSFWEGVDVPGEALEILFIPKLPFDVPSEPLIAARMDEIKKRGGNPFFEYSVPEAVIKFRQGFGRLLRSRTDKGFVLVADNRLSRMQYGKQFRNSLPVQTRIYQTGQEMLEDLGSFFGNT